MRGRYYKAGNAERPDRVIALRGIVFQSDGRSSVGRLFIRPLEAIDRWLVGILPRPGEPSLAMHAGIRVELDGGRDFVVEQLVGTWYLDFRNGLNWTPYHDFAARDRGGWDVTVASTCFRQIDEKVAERTIRHLNSIEGHPFMGEDCTAFVERAFGGRRLFADSPLLRWLGIGVRIGDPALPILRADAQLEPRAREQLQFETIKTLPDPTASVGSPNALLWAHRLIPVLAIGLAALVSIRWLRAGRPPSRGRRAGS